MTDYLNYRVNLFLKDGTKKTGTVSSVDLSQITLQEETASNSYLASLIADLKVTSLPKKKKRSKKEKASNGRNVDNNASNNNNADTIDNTNINDNEFDFQANLAMFDKKSVFASFKKTLEPKLVDYNKRKYANDEMVLAPQDDWEKITGTGNNNANDRSVNIANFSDFNEHISTAYGAAPALNSDSGAAPAANSSFSNISSAPAAFQSWDEPTANNSSELPKDNWDEIDNKNSRNNTRNSTNNNTRNNTNNNTGNNTPLKSNIPLNHSSTNLNSSNSKELKFVNQYRTINLASPIQLLEIERLSESFGFNQSLLNETSGTNLSKLIIRQLGDSTRLSNPKNHNLPPLVLILVGSSRCGARALSTGRHLANHGIRVVAFIINQDNLQNDISLFEHSGGKLVYNQSNELFDLLNKLDSPVELIIDALQGYDDHLEDIFYNKENELHNLINWLNQPNQANKIMALDLPSGIDGGSGIVNDENLQIKCKWCISFGLPVTGLLLAYKAGHLDDITHYLIDVGIPNKVYSSKSSLRKFDKFWHCAESEILMELKE